MLTSWLYNQRLESVIKKTQSLGDAVKDVLVGYRRYVIADGHRNGCKAGLQALFSMGRYGGSPGLNQFFSTGLYGLFRQ